MMIVGGKCNAVFSLGGWSPVFGWLCSGGFRLGKAWGYRGRRACHREKKCEYEAEAASQEGLTTEYARRERVRKLRDMCFEANGMVLISREVVSR